MEKTYYTSFFTLFLCSLSPGNLFSQQTEKVNQLKEVVVTAQFVAVSPEKSVHRVRIIDKKQIREKGATQLEDIFKTTLGFRMKQDNVMGETDFELMGLGGNSVKVLIDGIPAVDRGENKQSLSQMDVTTIERIEIVEGPMSVMYGTDALSGVINIITQKGKKVAQTRLGAHASIHEESVGQEYSFFGKSGIHRQNFSANINHKTGFYAEIGASHLVHGGWRAERNLRSLEWNPKTQTLLHGVVSYDRKCFSARYRLDFADEKLIVPGDFNIQAVAVDQKLLSGRLSHQLHLNYMPVSNLRFENASSFQYYSRYTRDIPVQLVDKTELVGSEISKDNTHYSLFFNRLTAYWSIKNSLAVHAGWESVWDSGAGKRIDRSRTIRSNSLFVSTQWSVVPKLQLRVGLRGVVQSDYNQPRFLPSVNAKWSLSPSVNLRLSYAQGFRAPKLRELYFNFYDNNHDMIGNPNLRPETSQNLMGGITAYLVSSHAVTLKSSLNGFYNHFFDRILMVSSKQKMGQFTYANIEQYKTAGMTLQNHVLLKNLDIDVSASFIGRYMVFNSEINTQTRGELNRFRFSTEATASFSYTYPDWGISAAMFYKYTGRRFNYYADAQLGYVLEGSDSYHLSDFSISKKVGKYLMIQLGIKNLFNVTSVFNNTSGGHANNSLHFIGSGRNYFCTLHFSM